VTDSNRISFGGWTLDRLSGELARDGATQRLPPQPLAMLVELLDHPGEVVTRERLVQILWPKGIVDFDNSLNAVVRRLRVAIGDDSDKPRYIETLPRAGYRFIGTLDAAGAPVTSDTARIPPGTRSGLPRWMLPIVAVLVVAGAAYGIWMKPKPVAPPESVNTSEPPPRSSNRRAYELYLDGKFHVVRRDTYGGGIAIERFEAAVREDPYFADAWGALALAYAGSGITQHLPIADAMEKARTAALRAIELDPKVVSGHAGLAVVKLQYDRDFAGAELELKAGMAQNDREGRLWHTYGLLRGYQGRTDESRAFLNRAREVEPMTLLFAYSYGNLLYHLRQYDEAIEYARPLLAAQPRFDQMRSVVIRSLIEKGDAKGALEQISLRHSDIPTLSDDGLAYARLGRRADAQRQIELLERRRADGYPTSYEIAIVHAALGEIEAACAALRQAIDDRSQMGSMRLDPRMDPLRGRQCFADVEAKLYGP
jgi:DNA-binding winged helix-turn-helix (wHTH) protein/tetratricopeptide (TPR) repeat protein